MRNLKQLQISNGYLFTDNLAWNKICTHEEYIKQGLSDTEAYAMRIHDHIFNKDQAGKASEKELNKMFAIVERLGL